MVKPRQSDGPGCLEAVASAEKSTMEKYLKGNKKSLHTFEELKEKIAPQLKE